MKWKVLLAALFMPALASAQMNITEATYWFDDNLAGAVTIPIAPAQQVNFDSSISTAGLTAGLHLVTIRFRQSNGKFSAPITNQFIKLPSGSGMGSKTIVACQYWFDNNYAGAITQATGPAGQLDTVVAASVAGLPKGPHIIHMRFRDNGNIWSSVMSQQFTKTNGVGLPSENVMTAYRCWVDTALSKMRTGYFQPAAQQGYLFTPLGFSNLDTGKHWLHYQFKDTMQVWSSVVSDTFIKLGRPRLDFISPNVGGNIGSVTSIIYGTGFYEGTSVHLTRNGSPDIIIPDTATNIITGAAIIVNFDLNGKDTGLYNLVVTVPNDTVMTLPNAFNVRQGIPPVVSASIVGPANIRIGQWQKFEVVFTNTGNTDAIGVPSWIAIPNSANYKLGFDFKTPLGSAIPFDSIDTYFISDTLFGKTRSYIVLPILLDYIAASKSVRLDIDLKVLDTAKIDIIAWASPAMFKNPAEFSKSNGYTSPIDQKIFNCVMDFYAEGVGVTPAGCLYGALDFATRPIINQALYGNPGTTVGNLGRQFIRGISDCITAPVKGWKFLTKSGYTKMKRLFALYQRGGIANDCLDAFWPQYSPGAKPIQPVFASDPNAKFGASGFGSDNFVFDAVLPYNISFENVETATAAAHTVRIVDSLDITVFDMESFELGGATVGDTSVYFTAGLKNIIHFIDYRPLGNPIILKIEASLDETTGVATWLFTTLDPETEQPTTNPIAGFLPPNVNSPEGQGSVSFTIKTKDGLPTNTVIKNKASIYFDNNPPIVTEPWINTIDISAPGSEVAALPEYTKDTIVKVHWSGRDTGAGIRDYTIYVSENGNPYRIWKFQTIDTAADFIGQFDSTYAFYSVATDHVGNKEKVPSNHDAITHLVRPDETTSGSISVYPNPTSGTFIIRGRHERSQDMTVTVTNIAGQLVQRDQIDNTGQPFQHTLDLSHLSKGYYNVTLSAGDWKQVFKLIKL